MSDRFSRLIPALIGVLLSVSWTAPPPALATRPYVVTESAVALPRGGARLESGLSYENWERGDRVYALKGELTYSLYANLDLEVEVPWEIAGGGGRPFDDGLGDIWTKAKINFVKERAANPLTLSGLIGIKFPTGSGVTTTDEIDVRLAALASKTFGPSTVHANLAYTFVGDNGLGLDNALGVSVGWAVQTPIPSLTAVGEFIWEDARLSGDNDRVEAMGGVRHRLTPRLIVDATLRVGFVSGAPPTDGAPDVALGFGLSYDLPRL